MIRSMPRRALSLILCVGLVASYSPFSAAQTVGRVVGVAPLAGGAAGIAAAAVAPQAGFLGEMNFALGGLNALTLQPTAPAAQATNLQAPAAAMSPEAAVLYMTALAAAPAAREEHAARQALIEYAARPSLRPEIEKALQTPAALAAGSGQTLASLKTFGSKIDALDKAQKRVLLEGLVSLRKKLYTSTAKGATIEGTRESLSRIFDNAGLFARPPPAAVEGAPASRPNPAPLLKAAAAKARQNGGFTIDTFTKPNRKAAKATEGIVRIIAQILQGYVRPVTAQGLLLGLAKKAEITGAVPQDPTSDPAERQEVLADLAAQLRLALSGDESEFFNGVAMAAYHFIRNGITPVRTPQDLYPLIKSIVAQTKDMYSRFLDPIETRDENLRMQSSYAGIGVTFGRGLVVGNVVPGSPAAKAGIQTGDRLLAIDGAPVSESEGFEKVRERIVGDPGTAVKVTLRRGDQELTVEAVRQILASPNLFASLLQGRPGVAYLHFNGFHRDTGPAFLAKLRELKAAGMESLIIDLRNNGGGDLATVNSIAALFLKKKQVIEHRREGRDMRTVVAGKDGEFMGLPVTVLVNKYSASASEILAAALQDNDRAEVVGERTWGKGVGQSVLQIPMQDQVTTLILTTLWWFAPSMRSIHSDVRGQGGVVPTTALTADEKAGAVAYEGQQHGLYADGKWDPASDPWIQKAADVAQTRR